MPDPTADTRSAAGTPAWVWAVLMVLTAVLAGVVAGLLTRADGTSVPGAVLTGGGAFAGTVALLLGLAHFLGGGRHRP